MPLGKLPYRPVVTARRTDAFGNPELDIQARDADNVLRGSATLSFGPDDVLHHRLQDWVGQVLASDAGGLTALADALIVNVGKAMVTGDPAYVPDAITLNGVSVATWTNQPAALTELAGSRIRMALALVSEVRLVANIVFAGSAGAELRAQYSIDGGTVWKYFGAPATTPAIVLSSTGPKESAWIPVPAEAKTDVLFRLAGVANNSTGDPQFGLTLLERR